MLHVGCRDAQAFPNKSTLREDDTSNVYLSKAVARLLLGKINNLLNLNIIRRLDYKQYIFKHVVW